MCLLFFVAVFLVVCFLTNEQHLVSKVSHMMQYIWSKKRILKDDKSSNTVHKYQTVKSLNLQAEILSLFLPTSHNKGSHDVSAAGHSSFDEGCETSTVPHFSIYTRIVVEEVHDCVDVTWR